MNEAALLQQQIVDSSIFRLEESTRMIRTSLALLKKEEIWKKPNTASNSIGNLVLHLCGNMHQYGIAGLGNSEDIRDRDREFTAQPDLSAEELLALLEKTVNAVKAAIEQCPLEELLLKRKVQGFDLSGIGIIIHVVEHYSYHTGQIAYWTKILKDQDLGFYDGIDLNAKNN